MQQEKTHSFFFFSVCSRLSHYLDFFKMCLGFGANLDSIVRPKNDQTDRQTEGGASYKTKAFYKIIIYSLHHFLLFNIMAVKSRYETRQFNIITDQSFAGMMSICHSSYLAQCTG